MNIDYLKQKQIAILGLGVNNRFLAQYLKQRGIEFEVFEHWDDPGELTGKIDRFDVVFRTPGLPYLSEPIQRALEKGIEVSSQTKLFFDLCPCPIVGVTGTKGKGTTATLLSKILEDGGEKVWLAGNIGQDPFDFLDELDVNDLVVLELSSFQLQDMDKSPHVAVVLKTTSEHLDYHKSREEYLDAKANIVRHQDPGDKAVIFYDWEDTRGFAELTSGEVWWNSVFQRVSPGSFVADDKLMLAVDDAELEIMPTAGVGLIGAFNLENITAAAAAAACLGTQDPLLLKTVMSEFKGLPHRLEKVREKDGVKYFNDSFSTTPETAMAALSAFESPVVLIIGGSEKEADYTKLAEMISSRPVKAVLAMGTTGPEIAEKVRKAGFQGRVIEDGLSDMEKIVKAASDLAREGDVVLLSPASASFDMFVDYKHRGELFKKYVERL